MSLGGPISRAVAVFDVDLPTGVAFVRSLGRAGVPVTAYSSDRRAAGRFSRFSTSFRPCPSVQETDTFVEWLAAEIDAGVIDLVAPTSDYVVFNLCQALLQLGRDPACHGLPTVASLNACLFKDRFAVEMASHGFPVPRTFSPTSVEGALDAAEELGYPIVLKPRSHVGLGFDRGDVVHTHEELTRRFAALDLPAGRRLACTEDPQLALPLVQQYLSPEHVDVVSVTGCLDADGELLALTHTLKLDQWPPPLGVGMAFRAVGGQPFTEHALRVVRAMLGRGMFELEVLVDRRTDRYWAVDLNPRAFGQIALDIALGHDLPMLWYGSITGSIPTRTRSGIDDDAVWRVSIPFFAGVATRLVVGPRRGATLRELFGNRRVPKVEAAFEWSDPGPGVAFAMRILRHPGGLVRPYLSSERRASLTAADRRSGVALAASTIDQ